MDCIYVRCLGEEEEERYEENNVTSKCQIRRDLPLDEKILERASCRLSSLAASEPYFLPYSRQPGYKQS